MNVWLCSSTTGLTAPVWRPRRDPQHLVAALVEQKREPRRNPVSQRTSVMDHGLANSASLTGISFLRFDVEQVRLADGNLVAGLEVGIRVELGLKLVFGRRFDLSKPGARCPVAGAWPPACFESGDQ